MAANQLIFGSKVVFVNGNPLTLPTAAADPGSGNTAGDLYYNSVSNLVKIYNGSVWGDINDGGAAAAAPAGALTGTTLAANVVNSSLTSVGTISVGVWQGTDVGVAYGGTGVSSFTAYMPVLGGTTSTGTLQSVSTAGASAGYVLTYVSSSAVPTWQAAATSGINQLTGDVTAGPGSGSQVATLATVNSNVGSFGSASLVPSFTVNAKGLITAASSTAVVAPAGTLFGTTLNSSVVTSSLTSLGIQAQTLDMGAFAIINLADPSAAQDAATKAYVDAAISGLYWQGPAKVYANSNVPLTGGATLTIDGYSVQNGDLVILGNQSTASQNGEYSASGIGTVYVLTANGLPTQAGDAWLILNGTVYADSAFVANAAVPAATFTEFAGPTAYVFSSPLTLTGRTVSITQSTTSTDGYLSSTDWNTFNNKQAAGNYITALTGDVTASGPGSAASLVAKIQGVSVGTPTGTGNVVFSSTPSLHNPTVDNILSSGTMLLEANIGTSPVNIYASSFGRSLDGSHFITETYRNSEILTDNHTAAISDFGFTAGTTAGEEITYIIENGDTPALVRIGTLRVTASSDGSNPSLTDTYSESGDCGVTWTASNVGTAISVNYTTTSTGHGRAMRADVKQLRY